MNKEIEALLQQCKQLPGSGKVIYYFDKVTLITNSLSPNAQKRVRRKIKRKNCDLTFKKHDSETTSMFAVGISKDKLRILCTELQGKFRNFEAMEFAMDLEYDELEPTAATFFPVGDSFLLNLNEHLSDVFRLKGKLYTPPGGQPEKDVGRNTLYFNFTYKTFVFVAYARISKVTGRHAIHMEFRIAGHANIKTKTGVSSITAMRKLNVERKFGELYAERIELSSLEIDYVKFGRVVLGLHGNVNLDESIKTYREALFCSEVFSRLKVEYYGETYCEFYELETPQAIYDHMKSLKSARVYMMKIGSEAIVRFEKFALNLRDRNHFAVND